MMATLAADILAEVEGVSGETGAWFESQISELRAECEKRGIPKAYVFAGLSIAAQIAAIDAITGIKCPEGREAMSVALRALLDQGGEYAHWYADSVMGAELAAEGVE